MDYVPAAMLWLLTLARLPTALDRDRSPVLRATFFAALACTLFVPAVYNATDPLLGGRNHVGLVLVAAILISFWQFRTATVLAIFTGKNAKARRRNHLVRGRRGAGNDTLDLPRRDAVGYHRKRFRWIVDGLHLHRGPRLSVNLSIAMIVLIEMAVRALHSLFQMNVRKVHRLAESLWIVERNNLVVLVEPVPFSIVFVDAAKNPAVPVVIGKLGMLELRIQFRDFVEELLVSP